MRKSKQFKEHVLKALGEAIRNRRVELELTQAEIGKAADIHRTYVTDVEQGVRNPSFLTLMRLATALLCPLSLIMIEKERILDSWTP